MPACSHSNLTYAASNHAEEVGYKRRNSRQLCDAAAPGRKASVEAQDPNPSTFPAPLVLPGDELSWSPNSKSTSLQSWIDGSWRNAVTAKRRTIYVAAPPSVAADTEGIKGWVKPRIKGKAKAAVPTVETDKVVEYLRAFYHPLPVKLLSTPGLEFVQWETSARSKDKSQRVGLSIGTEAIGIRFRPSKDKIFAGQLNLNDLLDVALAVLPKDAYALQMLVDHDLYEDEEDDFCCGRAYGGSRVSVVSMARYHPHLDNEHIVDREHAWPASHCAEYVEWCCQEEEEDGDDPLPPKKAKGETKKVSKSEASALEVAVKAHSALPSPKSAKKLAELWFGRVCKTASHELGHCFGIGHCVDYACIMQGTSCLPEDARQPPYLCPIDLAKVLYATGAKEAEWCREMLAFCEQYKHDRLLSAFAAWLTMRSNEVGSPNE